MTNPQKENGHLDMANELVDQFAKLHLSGNEWQIIWAIWRKTWSWHKKSDNISLTQFENITQLSRPSVVEAIDKLVGKKVLVVKKELYINEYSFNKLYNEWIVPKRELVGFSVSTSREKGTRVVGKKEPKVVGKKEHTKEKKETITKETIQKKYSSLEKIDDQVIAEIAEKYGVPETFVNSKLDDMKNWLEAKGKRYKNYKAALSNWVKADAIKILQKDHQQKSKFATTQV